jgi:hypothetical protein
MEKEVCMAITNEQTQSSGTDRHGNVVVYASIGTSEEGHCKTETAGKDGNQGRCKLS